MKYRDRFYTIGQGSNVMRILPSWREDVDDFGKKSVVHWGFQQDGKDSSITCLAAHTDQKCPICTLQAWLEARKDQDEDYGKWADRIFPKARYFLNAIIKDAGDELEGKVKIVEVGAMVMNDLMTILETPGYGDIADEDDGWDISISKSGSGRHGTKYSAVAVPNSQGPIELDDWDEQLHDLDAVVKQRLMTRKEIIEILENSFPQLPIEAICGTSKEGVTTKMAKRKKKGFKAPLDPETGEKLVWDPKEKGWGNERTGDLWDLPAPPEGWEDDEGTSKKKRKKKAAPPPEEEEDDEDEEWEDDDEEEDEDEDDEEEFDEDEDEDDEEEDEDEEEEADDDEWDGWDDEEDEEEEEPPPQKKKRKKKAAAKKKAKKEPAKKKRKKKEPEKKGKKKKSSKKDTKKKKGKKKRSKK